MRSFAAGEQVQPELKGDFVAALAIPELYGKNVGQVVTISTEQLRYVRRKELALKPYEIEVHNLSDCRSINYSTDFSLLRMTVGLIALALALVIVLGLATYFERLPAGKTIPITAIAVLIFTAFRYLTGGRRHILTFEMDGQTLRWISKPREFDLWNRPVETILAFAQGKGLYHGNLTSNSTEIHSYRQSGSPK